MVIKQVWLVWPYDCLETRQIEWKRSLKHWSLDDKSLVNIQKTMENQWTSPFLIGSSNISMAMASMSQSVSLPGRVTSKLIPRRPRSHGESEAFLLGIARFYRLDQHGDSPLAGTQKGVVQVSLWPMAPPCISMFVPLKASLEKIAFPSQPRLITQEAIWFHKF